jgi:hypothetical protein
VIPVVTNIVEKPQGGQVADEFLVDAGLGGEVEVREDPGSGRQANRGRQARRRSSVALTSISSSRSSTAVSERFSARAGSRIRGTKGGWTPRDRSQEAARKALESA